MKQPAETAKKKRASAPLPNGNYRRATRDWTAILLDYLESDYEEVGQFLQKNYGFTKQQSVNAGRHTAGWRDRKVKERNRANQRALDTLRKEREETNLTRARKLAKSHDALLELVNSNIVYWQENNFRRDKKTGRLTVISPIDSMALERMVKLVRTELGEPESLSTILLGGAQEQKKAPDLTQEEIDALNTFITRQLPTVETQIDAPTG